MITYSRLERAGRLGNQLWQIASTIGIAETLGQAASLPSDWSYRPFFQIPPAFFCGPSGTEAYNTDLVNHMDPRAREYLQDFNLWKHIAPKIHGWFQPSGLAMETLRSYEWFWKLPRPILSVHVRRGDNASGPNNCHPLRPISYYIDAIKAQEGKFESVVFFSDELEWCRTNLGDHVVEHEVAFFEGTPRPKEHEQSYFTAPILDWIDLQMMSFGDLHVLSNSTYSWWGAFLSHDPTPVYPTPFFGSDLDYIDTSLMFPESWLPIDHGQQYV